jgi:S1-C subfamily serine protease
VYKEFMARFVRSSQFLAGALGGLVVLVIGVVLISTGLIGSNNTREVIRQGPVIQSSASGQPGSSPSVADIYKRVAPGVVFIQSRTTEQGAGPFGLPGRQGVATGSGFVLDTKGDILTNAHVVGTARNVQVSFGDQTDSINADVIGADPSSDTAVVRVDPSQAKLTPIPLGDSSAVTVGDPAIAIGNPFGFDRTVTTGIISALQRQIQAPNGFSIDNVLQTDASINPGNSGGPLLDGAGRVIGVNSQIATGGSQGSVGIAFAVPINTVKGVVPTLESHGQVERPYLGLTTAPVTKQLAGDLHLPVDAGALVQAVAPGGPSEAAGLHAGNSQGPDGLMTGGDIIVDVAGKPVRKPEDVAAAIADRKPGDSVTVGFFRGQNRQQATVKLGTRPQNAPSIAPQQNPQGPPGGGGPGP